MAKKVQRCRDCNKSGSRTRLSKTSRLCATCQVRRQVEAIQQMSNADGDLADKWRRNLIAGVEAKASK